MVIYACVSICMHTQVCQNFVLYGNDYMYTVEPLECLVLDIGLFNLFILFRSISMAISIALTSLNLIIERKSGLFDRSWVAGKSIFIVTLTIFGHIMLHCAGVTVLEVIASQMFAYGVIACIQAAILTIFGVYVVNVSKL